MKKTDERVTERSIRFPDTLYMKGLGLARKRNVTFSQLIRDLLKIAVEEN